MVGLSCPIRDHPCRVEVDRAPEAGGLPPLPALGLLAQTEGCVVSSSDLDLNSILFSELQDESPTGFLLTPFCLSCFNPFHSYHVYSTLCAAFCTPQGPLGVGKFKAKVRGQVVTH